MIDINEIMKLCDNALDLGDTENITELLELLRAMLEPIYNFVEDTHYDGAGLYSNSDQEMASDTLLELLDIVEEF